jgi:hypothetical protein
MRSSAVPRHEDWDLGLRNFSMDIMTNVLLCWKFTISKLFNENVLLNITMFNKDNKNVNEKATFYYN